MSATSRSVGHASGPARLWSSERPFVVALTLGVLIRVVVQYSFPPAFVFSDGPTYLGFVDDLVPSRDRPVGYGVLLWALGQVDRGVDVVAVLQHLLGLLTAVVAYALLRRWGVSTWVATLGVLPLLLDEMELVVEHSVLSDVLFDLLIVLAVAVLAWWRAPRAWTTAVGGLLLGSAAVVRLIGEPALLAAVIFLVVVAGTWRSRLLHVVVVVVAFAVPMTAYAGWYHHEHDRWALTESSGRALYMRTTPFVDCERFTVPAYERPLCPHEPVGSRKEPTWYGWHEPDAIYLDPPPGMTRNEVMRDFARRAIRAQPGDYARVVARDLALGFWAPERTDHYEYGTAFKWRFDHYVDYQPTPGWTEPAYAAHGGRLPSTRQPTADALVAYSHHVYVPGPALLVLLVLAVAGLVVRRSPGAPSTRPLTFLTLSLGIGFVLVPVVTAEFVWRYQLPLLVLLPMSAALAWTRLRTVNAPEPAPPPAPTARTEE